MSNGPCAQSSCGGSVTYTPPAGTGSGNGSGGSSGGGTTYTPPSGNGSGGSGGGAGSSGFGSSLAETAKQEAKTNLESDLWFFGTWLIVLYLIIFFVRLIIAMFENIKPRPVVETNEAAEAEESRDDDNEELDDDYYIPESKFQSEEQEKAWREDLKAIADELDEEERREEMREQVREELAELEAKEKQKVEKEKDE